MRVLMPRGHPRGRPRWPCRHCDMVDDYRGERGRQLAEIENGGFRDETASAVVFKSWLRVYSWPSRDEIERWSAA